MVARYIVRDLAQVHQASYSVALGEDKAYQYALQCAKDVNGVIYQGEETGEETEIYRVKKENL